MRISSRRLVRSGRVLRVGRAVSIMLHDASSCCPCTHRLPSMHHARRTVARSWRCVAALSGGLALAQAASGGRTRRSIPSSSPRRAAPSARSTCRRRSTASTAPRSATASRRSTCPSRWSRVPGVFAAEPQQLRAGPADQLARLRRARDVRRARRAPVPGRHPGDDAGRAGPDRQLQPAVGAAHRGAARPVLHAVRQCLGRRDLRVHRGRHAPCRSSISPASVGSYARGMRA